MMKIEVNHDYIDDLNKLLANFKMDNGFELSEDSLFVNNILDFEKAFSLNVEFMGKKSALFLFKQVSKNDLRYANRRLIVDFLTREFGASYPYGVLLGIRPVKLVRKWLNIGISTDCLRHILNYTYMIEESTIDKLLSICYLQKRFLTEGEKAKKSVYISVPFCPSRCSYCSFVSNDILKFKGYLSPYLDSLKNEAYLKLSEDGLKEDIDCLYIGGGTPASPDLEYIRAMISSIGRYVDIKSLREFTFEGGRPDVLDEEKLTYLKSAGVTRLCVNPQTMRDDTLVRIGRKHNSDDFVKTFNIAKNLGFNSINTDLIIGLPGEVREDILYTVSEIIKLRPDNITLHSLSIKKGSRLSVSSEDVLNYDLSDVYLEVLTMIKEAGYNMYYLYRQKNIASNLDNIGFSLQNKECLYNIRMMEEEHDIIGLGSGSTSKNFSKNSKISTSLNPKNLDTYIQKYSYLIY